MAEIKDKTVKVKKRRPKIMLESNNIKKVLTEINMSAVELADLSGIDEAHMSKIINNKVRGITAAMAIVISGVLKRPVEQVFILKSGKK